MISPIGRRRLIGAGVLALLAAGAAAWLTAGGPDARGQTFNGIRGDRELYLLFRGSVDVYFAGSPASEDRPSVAGLKYQGVKEVVKEKYIYMKRGEAETWLINPANVAAFRMKRAE